jgi:hypothetical protein
MGAVLSESRDIICKYRAVSRDLYKTMLHSRRLREESEQLRDEWSDQTG